MIRNTAKTLVVGIVLGIGMLISAGGAAPEPLRLYVAENGNDAWSGRVADAGESDGPFATLQRARDEIRALKRAGSYPEDGVTVGILGGTYYLDRPLELTAEDSGTEAAPIVYQAHGGGTVRLSGGVEVSGFSPVTDEPVLARLDGAARGNVLQADLKSAGLAEYGPADRGGAEVFFRDQPMTLARWPNEGFVKIAGLAVEDGHQIHGNRGSKTGIFEYEGDRPERWMDEPDPWLHGYWFWDWSDQRQRIASIGVADATIALAEPYHHYGYREGQWYYAFNMLSELDAPGEWYIDREAGVLYFWPPEAVADIKVVVSKLDSLVQMREASWVSLRGLTLEAVRDTAVVADGGAHCVLSQCEIRNTGGWGARLSGKGHTAEGCEIHRNGGGGVAIAGGDRATLEPGGLVADNNHIHHYGRIERMYTPAVSMTGVGNRVTHNLIHSAPHIGIQFTGNEHLIEFNEIHHVCLESNDAGAIYTGRDWTMRGNMIRHNYLHHITGFEDRGCVGVYLDDMFSSADIVGNVFYRVTRAAFIGGGRDCSIVNNIFVDCDPAIHVDARALGWAGYHADEWIEEANAKGTLKGIEYQKPPYSERYPKLPGILDNEPKAPVGNLIARNIGWGGKWDGIYDAARPYLEIGDNLIQVDPLFVDEANRDFRLRPDSPAFELGFEPIPIEKIGLRRGR